MTAFSFSAIARLLGTRVPVEGEITHFAHDSREVGPGSLFFALKGERVDGHAFLAEVAKRGAKAAVVAHEYRGADFGLTLFRVEDVLKALHEMARLVQAARKGRIIAVTGSVGKTTTKEFIASLLESRLRVAKTPGNCNSQVSFPLSLLNAQEDADIYVAEMGMSQAGEISRLVSIAPPEIAVVTNISYSHALFFPQGIEGIARAKAEIFSSSKTHKGIIHAQAAAFTCIKELSLSKVIYGPQGKYLLEKGEGGVYIIEEGDRSPLMHLPFSASHLCENFLGAVAVAREMGLTWEEIGAKAPCLTTLSKRFEKINYNGIIFINDSYNANMTSMIAALDNLPLAAEGKKRIAVLGSMKELGAYSDAHHHQVGLKALESCDLLLCLGEECQGMVDLFRAHKRLAELHPDLFSLKTRLFELAQSGDVVLLKGSKSHSLWKLLEAPHDLPGTLLE